MVRFETGEGWLWEIKLTPQSFALPRCEDTEDHGVTTNVVLGNAYIQLVGYVHRQYQYPCPLWVFDNIVENLKKWAKVLYFNKWTNEINL